MKTIKIERFGGLLKEESLSCIENDILLKDTCVLESVSPFFGYYEEKGAGSKPMYLYFMLDDHHTVEEILRSVNEIKKVEGFIFDAVHAEITLPGYPAVSAIRIRDLANYNQIAKLQENFMKYGLHFKKKSRSLEKDMSLIRLEKFLSLTPKSSISLRTRLLRKAGSHYIIYQDADSQINMY